MAPTPFPNTTPAANVEMMRPSRFAALVAALTLLVMPAVRSQSDPSHFVDPTARLIHPGNIHFGDLVYVAPFATLKAGTGQEARINIGSHSDIQDNTLLDAQGGSIQLGEDVIVAHGATIVGPADVGVTGTCPEDAVICASFVSFNAEVDGATIEKDAMVSALSRVGPGITLPSGLKTIPGRSIDTQEEIATETSAVTEADREFMSGVIHVNEAFELNYQVMAEERASNVRGINYDPGNSDFNPERDLPVLAGKSTRDPKFRNRIIGEITLADGKKKLSDAMGNKIALRADEGDPFSVGTILCMANRVTFHALEHTHLELGDDGCYGYHSIVHGGPTDFEDTTITGNGFVLGPYSLFFRSRAGDDVTIGYRSVVQQSDLADGAVVPARTIMIDNVVIGTVEW